MNVSFYCPYRNYNSTLSCVLLTTFLLLSPNFYPPIICLTAHSPTVFLVSPQVVPSYWSSNMIMSLKFYNNMINTHNSSNIILLFLLSVFSPNDTTLLPLFTSQFTTVLFICSLISWKCFFKDHQWSKKPNSTAFF